MQKPDSGLPRTPKTVVAAGAVALIVLMGASRAPQEAPFLALNTAAMDRMMAGMAVKPTGDADQDFVAMMEPHHRAAIDMAQAELRFGHNEQLRRIAQEIIVEQQQEIAAMRLAIGRALPPRRPAPDAAALDAMTMSKDGATSIDTRLRSAVAFLDWRPRGALPPRPPSAGAAPTGHPGEPSRPRLCRRAVLQHGLGDRPGRQPAAWRHPAGRSAAGQLQPALQGPGPCPRAGLLAGPPDAGGGVDRIERASPSSTPPPMR